MSTPTGRREALEVLTRRGLSRRKACCYPGLSRRVAKLAKLPPGSKAPDPEKNGIIPGGGYCTGLVGRSTRAWLGRGARLTAYKWCSTKEAMCIRKAITIRGHAGHCSTASCKSHKTRRSPNADTNWTIAVFSGRRVRLFDNVFCGTDHDESSAV